MCAQNVWKPGFITSIKEGKKKGTREKEIQVVSTVLLHNAAIWFVKVANSVDKDSKGLSQDIYLTLGLLNSFQNI